MGITEAERQQLIEQYLARTADNQTPVPSEPPHDTKPETDNPTPNKVPPQQGGTDPSLEQRHFRRKPTEIVTRSVSEGTSGASLPRLRFGLRWGTQAALSNGYPIPRTTTGR